MGDEICAARLQRDKTGENLVREKIDQFFNNAPAGSVLQLLVPVNMAYGYAPEAPQARYKAQLIGSMLEESGITFSSMRAHLSEIQNLTPEQSAVLQSLGKRGVFIFKRTSSSVSGMGIRSAGRDEFPGFEAIRNLPGLSVVEIPADNSLSSGSAWGGRYGYNSEIAIFPTGTENYIRLDRNLLLPRLFKELAARLNDPEVVERFADRIHRDVSDEFHNLRDPLATRHDYTDNRVYITALVRMILWQRHSIELKSGYLPFPRLRSRPFFYFRKGEQANSIEVVFEQGARSIVDDIAGQLHILRDRLHVEETGGWSPFAGSQYQRATIHVTPYSGND